MDEATCSLIGFRVTITRSAGLDKAVLVFIDGPLDDEGDYDPSIDEMPDGQPRVRILLNDSPIYAPVDYEQALEAEQEASHEAREEATDD